MYIHIALKMYCIYYIYNYRDTYMLLMYYISFIYTYASYIYIYTYTGCWFDFIFIFPYFGNYHPN